MAHNSFTSFILQWNISTSSSSIKRTCKNINTRGLLLIKNLKWLYPLYLYRDAISKWEKKRVDVVWVGLALLLLHNITALISFPYPAFYQFFNSCNLYIFLICLWSGDRREAVEAVDENSVLEGRNFFFPQRQLSAAAMLWQPTNQCGSTGNYSNRTISNEKKKPETQIDAPWLDNPPAAEITQRHHVTCTKWYGFLCQFKHIWHSFDRHVDATALSSVGASQSPFYKYAALATALTRLGFRINYATVTLNVAVK